MKKRKNLVAVLLAITIISIIYFQTSSAVNISTCQTLNSANTVYTLTTDLTNTTHCFMISANNITLDGQGHSIYGTNVHPIIGVYLIQNSNYSTVKNLNVYNFSIGIYSPYAPNQTFINNTVVNSSNYGFYLPSYSNNILVNNTVLRSGLYGVALSSSSNNTVSNNRIESSQGYGFYLSNAHRNIFTNNIVLNNTQNSFYLFSAHNNSFSFDYINNSRENAFNISGSNLNNFSSVRVSFTNSSRYDFYISDSNETKLSNYTEVMNYSFVSSGRNIFEDLEYGKIQIFNALNSSGKNLTSDIIFGNNSVFVNSSSNQDLNKSANVTLYGIGDRGLSNPVVLKDGEVCSDCYNFTSLSSETVIFNVSSWGSYSIGEGPSAEESVEEETTSSPAVGGYPVFNPSEDELNKGYNRIMLKNWKISFNMSNEVHTLKIESISGPRVDVSVSSEFQEATIRVGEEKKFDVSGDSDYDILVKLNSIDNANKANITLQRINEETRPSEDEDVMFSEKADNTQDSKEDAKAKSSRDSSGMNFAGIIVLVLLGTVVFYFYKKRSSQNKSDLRSSHKSKTDF